MEQALFSNGESEVVRIGMKKKIKGGGVEKGEGWEGESIFFLLSPHPSLF